MPQKNKIHIELQNHSKHPLSAIDMDKVQKYVEAVFVNKDIHHPLTNEISLTLRLVDTDEITHLNKTYRNKDKSTNVLTFPNPMTDEMAFELSVDIDRQTSHYLGDIVLCIPVVESEAKAQNKFFEAHLAHMLIHSTLHLLNYDHEQEQQAIMMEKLETTIMNELGFLDPYGEDR